MSAARGRLVSIEGIDGAGKNTVIRLLRPRFPGVLFTAEPTRNWLGQLIREGLRDGPPLPTGREGSRGDRRGPPILPRVPKGREIEARFDETRRFPGGAAIRADPLALCHLFLMDHAVHVARTVRPSLARGRSVVTNRYIDSRLAYQGATLRGRVPGDPVEWLRKAHTPWTVWPDRTVLLVLDPREAVGRLAARRGGKTTFEKVRFLQQVQENYRRVAREEPARVAVVSADGTPREVARRVETEVRKGLS